MRDFFLGHWERYGGDSTFFPDKIIFEADPDSLDRLLVTFNFKCQIASCSATKMRSEVASVSSVATNLIGVRWFMDPAGYQYDALFQEAQTKERLVANAAKEIITVFSVMLPMNRLAHFAGTLDDNFRYFVPLPIEPS